MEKMKAEYVAVVDAVTVPEQIDATTLSAKATLLDPKTMRDPTTVKSGVETENTTPAGVSDPSASDSGGNGDLTSPADGSDPSASNSGGGDPATPADVSDPTASDSGGVGTGAESTGAEGVTPTAGGGGGGTPTAGGGGGAASAETTTATVTCVCANTTTTSCTDSGNGWIKGGEACCSDSKQPYPYYSGYNVSCSATSTTSTTTTTASTPTETCANEVSGVCIPTTAAASRCELGILSGSSLTTAKILCIFAIVWIIIWCIATIVVNILHKNNGHHRFIHLYEEIFIILLYICIGLNLLFRGNQTSCKIVSILCHFFMVVVAGAFMLEGFFAHSMAHGKPAKNGCIPPVANYIIPILLALIPTLVTYFTQKEYYGTSGLHCFASIPHDPFWGFVISVWLLLLIAGLKGSLGCLACDMTQHHQDISQRFWCKKSAKCLMFFSFFLMMTWLTCMFASSQQLLSIFVLFFLESLCYGPMIFIYHTYCHINSSVKLSKSFLGKFYVACIEDHMKNAPNAAICTRTHYPTPPPSPPPGSPEKTSETPPPNHEPAQPQAEEKPPGPAPPPTRARPPPFRPTPQAKSSPRRSNARDTHAFAGEYYDWLSDPSQGGHGKSVLFRPRPM